MPQKAFAFINKEQWDDARSEAMAAYQLRPDQLEALRAVARYLTRLHSIEVLDFWQSSDLFLQHLDALDGLGRWNEIEQEIRIGKFPLELFLAAMYLARFNSQLGEQTASANKQDEASGSALAVHAAIFAATNLENGKTEATQLKREQLLPEEQALVKSLLHG